MISSRPVYKKILYSMAHDSKEHTLELISMVYNDLCRLDWDLASYYEQLLLEEGEPVQAQRVLMAIADFLHFSVSMAGRLTNPNDFSWDKVLTSYC